MQVHGWSATVRLLTLIRLSYILSIGGFVSYRFSRIMCVKVVRLWKSEVDAICQYVLTTHRWFFAAGSLVFLTNVALIKRKDEL